MGILLFLRCPTLFESLAMILSWVLALAKALMALFNPCGSTKVNIQGASPRNMRVVTLMFSDLVFIHLGVSSGLVVFEFQTQPLPGRNPACGAVHDGKGQCGMLSHSAPAIVHRSSPNQLVEQRCWFGKIK